MRFPLFMFAVTVVVTALISALTQNADAMGFLIPAFFVCVMVALANLLAPKSNRPASLR